MSWAASLKAKVAAKVEAVRKDRALAKSGQVMFQSIYISITTDKKENKTLLRLKKRNVLINATACPCSDWTRKNPLVLALEMLDPGECVYAVSFRLHRKGGGGGGGLVWMVGQSLIRFYLTNPDSCARR